MRSIKTFLRYSGLLLAVCAGQLQAATDKPNILVIWGDDIGQSNISSLVRRVSRVPIANTSLPRRAITAACANRMSARA